MITISVNQLKFIEQNSKKQTTNRSMRTLVQELKNTTSVHYYFCDKTINDFVTLFHTPQKSLHEKLQQVFQKM